MPLRLHSKLSKSSIRLQAAQNVCKRSLHCYKDTARHGHPHLDPSRWVRIFQELRCEVFAVDDTGWTHFRGGTCSATTRLSDEVNGESGDVTVFVEDLPSARAAASVKMGHLERGRGSKRPKKGHDIKQRCNSIDI